MAKAKRYDMVMLQDTIGGFHKGAKGSVVEVYTTPYEAYDIEIVTDGGKTKGVAEAIRPEQIEVLPSPVRFTSIRVEADGSRAAVVFSDGTEVTVQAEELYTQTQQTSRARLYVVLPAVIGLLRHEGRVTYGALKQIFGCDETFLQEVREELFFKRLAIDEDGKGLVWTGASAIAVPSPAAFEQAPFTTETPTPYIPREHHALAWRYGMDLGASSGSFLAWELCLLGYPDQALHHSQETRMLAKAVSHPNSLAFSLLYAAVLHQHRRDTLAAHEQAEATITLSSEQGFSLWLATGMLVYGWALVMQGQGDVGIAQMHQGLAAYRATGAKVLQPYLLGLLAEAYGEGRHSNKGLNALAEALAVMDATETRFYAAELYRLKGALLLKQATPDTSQAEACFHQALDIACRQSAKSWELRAATSVARLWQQQNKRQEAYDLLAPVYNWFTEGFDTVDLQEAKTLLDALA